MQYRVTNFFLYIFFIFLFIFIQNNLFMIIGLASFSLSVLYERRGKYSVFRSQKEFILLYYAFILYALLSFFYAIDKDLVVSSSLDLLLIMFTVLIFSQYFQTDNLNRHIKFLSSIYLSGVVSLIYIMLHPATDFSRYIGRVVANPNIVALMLCFSLFANLALYLRDRKKLRIITLVFLTVGILLTGSRQALILMVIGVSSFAFSFNNYRIKPKTIISIAVFLLLIIYLIINNSYLYNTIGESFLGLYNSIFNNFETVDNSTSLRISFIENGLLWLKNRFAFGYGLDNFKALSLSTYGIPYYAHNNFIDLLVGLGTLGTLLYYLLFLFSLIKLKRINDKSVRAFYFASLVFMLFSGVFTVHWSRFLYYILIIASISYKGEVKHENTCKK